jgi:thioredoxin 1
MTIELDDRSFQEAVAKGSKPVLVDFYATWCGPCVQQAPILEKWAEGRKAELDVAKLDVDKSPTTASKFGVLSIPTLIIFSAGKERARAVGRQTEKELDALLAKATGKKD